MFEVVKNRLEAEDYGRTVINLEAETVQQWFCGVNYTQVPDRTQR